MDLSDSSIGGVGVVCVVSLCLIALDVLSVMLWSVLSCRIVVSVVLGVVVGGELELDADIVVLVLGLGVGGDSVVVGVVIFLLLVFLSSDLSSPPAPCTALRSYVYHSTPLQYFAVPPPPLRPSRLWAPSSWCRGCFSVAAGVSVFFAPPLVGGRHPRLR